MEMMRRRRKTTAKEMLKAKEMKQLMFPQLQKKLIYPAPGKARGTVLVPCQVFRILIHSCGSGSSLYVECGSYSESGSKSRLKVSKFYPE
jgi:hypothetical protein